MEMLFADEAPAPTPDATTVGKKTWCVLMVDDDEEVHTVTRLALRNFDFQGQELELLSAYSAKDGRAIF